MLYVTRQIFNSNNFVTSAALVEVCALLSAILVLNCITFCGLHLTKFLMMHNKVELRLSQCCQHYLQAQITVDVGPRHCTTVCPSDSHLSPSTQC